MVTPATDGALDGKTVIKLHPDSDGPDGGQKALLRHCDNPNVRELYIIGSRRRGKSWTIAVAGVRFGLANPTSPADVGLERPRRTEIAIVAPDYARTEPIFDEIRRWFKECIYHEDRNKLEILLRHPSGEGPGAMIKCWSGDNLDSIRGRGYDLVIADEAAFLNEALIESAVMPTLLDRHGRLWAPSTPKFGRKNWWCARWLAAKAAQDAGTPIPGVIAFHLGTTWDNKRLDPADVEREVSRRDPLTVEEEYKGNILDNASNWLDHTKLIPVSVKDIPGNTFNVILIDSAWGKPRSGLIDKQTRRRKDATVIAVIGQDNQGNVYCLDGVWAQEMTPEQAFEIMEGFVKKYNVKRIGKEIIADDPFFSNWNSYCKQHTGIPVVPQVPFSRGKDWKVDGIRYWAGEVLFKKRMFIEQTCSLWPHAIDEMGNYNEADSIQDKCHDDILSVFSDILKPGIWQGARVAVSSSVPLFDPFYLADAWKNGVVERHRRPKKSKYSIM